MSMTPFPLLLELQFHGYLDVTSEMEGFDGVSRFPPSGTNVAATNSSQLWCCIRACGMEIHNGLLVTCATIEIAEHSGLITAVGQIPSGRCTTSAAGRVEGIEFMVCNMMLMLTARMAATTAASTVAAILEQAQAPS